MRMRQKQNITLLLVLSIGLLSYHCDAASLEGLLKRQPTDSVCQAMCKACHPPGRKRNQCKSTCTSEGSENFTCDTTGQCPEAEPGQIGICANVCEMNSQCYTSGKICCRNGCGGYECSEPIF